jgi:uroporphyrinogen-III synthase
MKNVSKEAVQRPCILITRRQDDCAEIMEGIAPYGLGVVPVKALAINYCGPLDSFRPFTSKTWLIFTSRHAVLGGYLWCKKHNRMHDFSQVKIAVVGLATAKHVQDTFARKVDWVAHPAHAEQLARDMLGWLKANDHVFWFHGKPFRDTLRQSLATCCYFEMCGVYESQAVDWVPLSHDDYKRIIALWITSPQIAQWLHKHLGGFRWPCFTLGPSTTTTVLALGGRVYDEIPFQAQHLIQALKRFHFIP